MKSEIYTARRYSHMPGYLKKLFEQYLRLSNITESINDIRSDLSLRNERDKYKDETIHRLTNKLEDLEKGKDDDIKISIYKSILIFYDSLERFQKKFEYITDEKLKHDIEFLKDEVIDELLFNNDVEPVDRIIGENYNRDYHKVKDTIAAEDPAKDGIVKSIVKEGFIYKGKVIRKQEVIIYKYI